jgi:hypothetical protein
VQSDVVEQDHIQTMQPDAVALNQILLPLAESHEEQSLELVPNTTSTPFSPPTETTATTITETIQNGAPPERPIVSDQTEDRDTPSDQDTTSGDAVNSASPPRKLSKPPHEADVVAPDTKSTHQSIPSGGQLLPEVDGVIIPEYEVDNGETAPSLVLPDPPSTDPTLSRSETTIPLELDTKLSQSEVTAGTLYITLLSPEELHEQRVSYLVGELPKVAVMVPHVMPQITIQEVDIQEEKEAEQAAEKIEAERDELEKSGTYSVGPLVVEETKTSLVVFEDESTLPVESVTEGQRSALMVQCRSELKSPIEIGISDANKILDEPPNIVQESGNFSPVTANRC